MERSTRSREAAAWRAKRTNERHKIASRSVARSSVSHADTRPALQAARVERLCASASLWFNSVCVLCGQAFLSQTMKVLIADKFEQSGIEGLKGAGCDVVYQPDLK